MSLNDLCEIYICIILTAEFIYDARLNAHVKKLKKRVKRNYDFENLNVGEGR